MRRIHVHEQHVFYRIFSGKAVITSDGYTILESLQAEHPIAQLIFKALKRCHTFTLDGCKFFLLLLDGLLIEISTALSQGKFCHSGTYLAQNRSALEAQGLLCARLSLRHLTSVIQQNITTEMERYCCKLYQTVLDKGQLSVRDVMVNVCKTALMSHYNPKVCDFLVSKLLAALPDQDLVSDKFITTLDTFVSKFYSLIVRIPDRPYSQCSVVDPLIMKCKFTVKCDSLGKDFIKAVVLRSGLDHLQAGEQGGETLVVKSCGQMTALLLQRRKVVQQFAESCVRFGINLILCTESVPSFAAEMFQRHGISVVAYAWSEEVELLEIITKKTPLVSLNDDIAVTNIIPIEGVSEVFIGGQRHLQFETALLQWKHLVLCAPTVGLCDQLAMVCQKALNAVKLCFSQPSVYSMDYRSTAGDLTDTKKKIQDNSDNSIKQTLYGNIAASDQQQLDRQLHNTNCSNVMIVPGGGTFEFILATKLQKFSKTCGDANVIATCNCLKNALLNVLKVLYKNTTIENDKVRGFIEVQIVLEEKFKSGCEVWGLNRRGCPTDMAGRGVFEPLQGKMHVVQCVLDLVDQLLRVDKVVSIKQIVNDSSDEEDVSD